jgi:hypothetical protein
LRSPRRGGQCAQSPGPALPASFRVHPSRCSVWSTAFRLLFRLKPGLRTERRVIPVPPRVHHRASSPRWQPVIPIPAPLGRRARAPPGPPPQPCASGRSRLNRNFFTVLRLMNAVRDTSATTTIDTAAPMIAHRRYASRCFVPSQRVMATAKYSVTRIRQPAVIITLHFHSAAMIAGTCYRLCGPLGLRWPLYLFG